MRGNSSPARPPALDLSITMSTEGLMGLACRTPHSARLVNVSDDNQQCASIYGGELRALVTLLTCATCGRQRCRVRKMKTAWPCGKCEMALWVQLDRVCYSVWHSRREGGAP
ncbi:hypothetical protein AAFF_G00229610 [Aldrovandia affinis]|uniref:Uncharacterized protein n=1 Tax=Aldrovandia affinis TaxID=143900 RepID=A0AAD7WUK5_9TELE|nr:hypothetical protein AAFF_G00229610 [Aldrovandia affinis]